MSDKSNIPPAVGEFTMQERAKLLSDNADLRARLAKYEDAEGRPLQPAADLARRIDQAITEFTSGRACMHVPPRDTDVDIVLSECLKLANALESQAREIERLGKYKRFESQYHEAERELDALKAQPSGVVPAALGSAFITCESGDAGYRVVIKSETLQEAQQVHNWLAHLNSSPVSAGDDAFCDGNCTWLDHHPSCARAAGQSVSAGGVDDRAAFEAWYETTYGISLEPEFRANHFIGYVNDKANHRWTAWQARAALSAPSHGEQVRQMVPSWMASARTFVDRLHLAGWRDHADAQHAGVAGMYDELLAAAPSPSKQGEV